MEEILLIKSILHWKTGGLEVVYDHLWKSTLTIL